MVSLDGAPGYQHHCPELVKGQLQTLVILPISNGGQQHTDGFIYHIESTLRG